jgi:hypothetical protein
MWFALMKAMTVWCGREILDRGDASDAHGASATPHLVRRGLYQAATNNR